MHSSSRKRLRQSVLSTASVGIRLLLALSMVLAYLAAPMAVLPEYVPVASAQISTPAQLDNTTSFSCGTPIVIDGATDTNAYITLQESAHSGGQSGITFDDNIADEIQITTNTQSNVEPANQIQLGGQPITTTRLITRFSVVDGTTIITTVEEILSTVNIGHKIVSSESSNNTVGGNGDIQNIEIHADYNYLYIYIDGPGALGSNANEPIDIINLYIALDLDNSSTNDPSTLNVSPTLPYNNIALVDFGSDFGPDVLVAVDDTSTVTMYQASAGNWTTPTVVSRVPTSTTPNAPAVNQAAIYSYTVNNGSIASFDTEMQFEFAIPWQTLTQGRPWLAESLLRNDPGIKLVAFTTGDAEGLYQIPGVPPLNPGPWDLLDIAPGPPENGLPGANQAFGPDDAGLSAHLNDPDITAATDQIAADVVNTFYWFKPDPALLDCRYDLAIDKEVSGSAIAGSPLTYVITYTNLGITTSNFFTGYAMGAVSTVTLSDTLSLSADQTFGGIVSMSPTLIGTYPSYVVSGTMENGDVGTLVFTSTIDPSVNLNLAPGKVITNEIRISGDVTANDIITTNNYDIVTTTVGLNSVFQIDKTIVNADEILAGDVVTFNVTITNVGPSDAYNVLVQDSLNSGAAITVGTYLTMSAGGSETIMYTTTMPTNLVSGTDPIFALYQNVATVSSDYSTPISDTANFEVASRFDLGVRKYLITTTLPITPMGGGSVINPTFYYTNPQVVVAGPTGSQISTTSSTIYPTGTVIIVTNTTVITYLGQQSYGLVDNHLPTVEEELYAGDEFYYRIYIDVDPEYGPALFTTLTDTLPAGLLYNGVLTASQGFIAAFSPISALSLGGAFNPNVTNDPQSSTYDPYADTQIIWTSTYITPDNTVGLTYASTATLNTAYWVDIRVAAGLDAQGNVLSLSEAASRGVNIQSPLTNTATIGSLDFREEITTTNNDTNNPFGPDYDGNPDVTVLYPALELEKSMLNDAPNVSKIGGFVDFTMILTNSGSTDLTNIHITDPLIAANPNNPICEAFNTLLPAGEVLTLNCTMEVTDTISTLVGEVFTNTAYVTATNNSNANFIADVAEINSIAPLGLNNGFPAATITITDEDDQDVEIASPEITVQLKRVESTNGITVEIPFGMAAAGEVVTLSVNIINQDDRALSNIAVTSNIDACNNAAVGDLGPLGVVSGTIQYYCTFTMTGDITPTVTATGYLDIARPPACDVSATDMGVIHRDVRDEIMVEKGVFGRDFPFTAYAGETIIYRIDVTNTGDIDLTNVYVFDPLIAETSVCEDNNTLLSVDQTTTLFCDWTVPSDAVIDTVFTNTVQVSYEFVEAGMTNRMTETDTATVTVVAAPVANIDVTIDEVSSVIAGDSAEFVVTVTNIGTVDLENVSVVSNVPACNRIIGSLAVGETQTYTCSSGTLVADIQAQVNAIGDGIGVSEVASDVDIVEVTVQLPVMVIEVGPDQTVTTGDSADMVVTVTNNSGFALSDVDLTTNIPGCNQTIATIADGDTITLNCATGALTSDFIAVANASISNSDDVVIATQTDTAVVNVELPVITGIVYHDIDNDGGDPAPGPDDGDTGISNFTEAGIPNVLIELVDIFGSVVDTAMTDVTGAYTLTASSGPTGYTVIARWDLFAGDEYAPTTPAQVFGVSAPSVHNFGAILEEDPATVTPTVTPMPATATATATAEAATEVPTATPTATATSTPTMMPTATNTSTATSTSIPTNTSTPTDTPTATNTYTPVPTATPQPTYTPLPTYTLPPTSTYTPMPTWTLVPTSTPEPTWTLTTVPPTNTPLPTSTYTMTPEPATEVPTNTPLPTNTVVPTNTPLPTNTALPTNTLVPTNTPIPTATATNTPMPTETAMPTATNTRMPAYLAGSVAVVEGEIAIDGTAKWNITVMNTGEMDATNTNIEVDIPVGTVLSPESEALGWSCTEVTAAGEEAVTSCILKLNTVAPNQQVETFLSVRPGEAFNVNDPEIQEPGIVVMSDTTDNMNISTGVGNNIQITELTPTGGDDAPAPVEETPSHHIYLPIITQ